MKPEIRVYDRAGKDVTGDKEWFLGMDGHLYYNDSEEGICIDTEHHYSIVMRVTEAMTWETLGK